MLNDCGTNVYQSFIVSQLGNICIRQEDQMQNNPNLPTGLAGNAWFEGEGKSEHGRTSLVLVLLLLAHLSSHLSAPLPRIQLTSGDELPHSPPFTGLLPGGAEQVLGRRAGHRGQVWADV